MEKKDAAWEKYFSAERSRLRVKKMVMTLVGIVSTIVSWNGLEKISGVKLDDFNGETSVNIGILAAGGIGLLFAVYNYSQASMELRNHEKSQR